MDCDFREWSTENLKERVKIVRSFDSLVEKCKATFIDYCKTFDVVEETVQVPKKIKVLREAK